MARNRDVQRVDGTIYRARRWRYLSCIFLVLLLALGSCCSCQAAESAHVTVGRDGWTFELAGKRFVPFGVNYDHDENNRLLEDYWVDEWEKVEEDFAEIRQLGFNVVRIHLQFSRFQSGFNTPNGKSLEQLDRLVALARRNNLYLLITGLAFYRKSDIPEWYRKLDDENKLNACRAFWQAIASRYVGETAIFAYDIQNEPSINWTDDDSIVGPPFSDGYHYINRHYARVERRWFEWVRKKYSGEAQLKKVWPDYPLPGESFDTALKLPSGTRSNRLRDYLEFRDQLAVKWCKGIISSIREIDGNHMITVGLMGSSLPFNDFYCSFDPRKIGQLFDFTCMHVHLSSTDPIDLTREEMSVRQAYVGKPVVIEELFSLSGPKATNSFLSFSKRNASGWFSYYWGETLEQLKEKKTLEKGIYLSWLKRYLRFGRTLRESRQSEERPIGDLKLQCSRSELVSSSKARQDLVRSVHEERMKGRIINIIIKD